MYKRLSIEDFTTDYMPVIESMGVTPGATLSTGFYSVSAGVLGGTPSEDFKYRQIANIIKGDSTFTSFNNKFPSSTTISIATIDRKKFKESIHPSSFSVSGVRVKTGSNDVDFCEAGRVYKATNNSYYLYPDIGVVVAGGVNAFSGIKACSEETITISRAHIYAGRNEFNYSTNPSFANKEGTPRFPAYDSFKGPYGSNREDWINNPVVYITTIGFYNDNGDLLAVAKLPKPFKKDSYTAFSTNVEFKF